MRVLTLNVQSDAGGRARTALINAELRRLRPDLVALQEVRYPLADWDQLAELLDGTGLTYTTHQSDVLPQLPELFRHDGSAVATRWPHQVVDVRQGLGDPHWWTLAVSVELPDVGEVLFIAPTTPWQLDHEPARERQCLEIAETDARYRTSVPTIIAGDLNATPESAGVRFLTGLQSLNGRGAHYVDAWTVAGDGPGYTWTTDNPLGAAEIRTLLGQSNHHRRIDYILTGSPHNHPISAEILTTHLIGVHPPHLSDHYGVTTDLAFRR